MLKLSKGGLKVDVSLLPPNVLTDAVKYNPATLLDFTPHNLYPSVINNCSNYTGWDPKAYKSLHAYQYLCQDR